jgi:glycosyltransferase involved in cell wall biosynthesis
VLRPTNMLGNASPTSRTSHTFDGRLRRLKIAYVVTRSDLIGGAQVHVRDLAAAVVRHGHEAVILAGGSGPYMEAVRDAGVENVSLKHLGVPIRPHLDALALGELCSELRHLKPDLISVHSSKAGVLGRVAGRVLGLPVIHTAHGWSFTPGIPRRKASMYRWIERLAAPLASRIITVSEFDRQLALTHRLAPAERVVTVHNGMPDIGSGLAADPARSPARLVMIARFEPQKDHATLFRALREIGEPWHLDLIGDGPLLDEAQAIVRDFGLIDRVQFWGQRLDVAQRLAEAQAAVLITNWEGFPRSILEAMRAGLPVVASGVGGVAESVQDGKTGFIVPRGDVEALRVRLRQLLADPELRLRMGRGGRERYEAHFTLEHTVEKTLAVYEQTLGGDRFGSCVNGRGSNASKLEQL